MTAAAQESQTTPIVTGTDIFKFGTADVAPGPGEAKPESATPAPDAADHPGEAEGKPDIAAGKPLPQEEEPKGTPRFKDHAAAEEGYKNLQSKATKAEQEAAELRKKIADYEAQQKAASEQATQSARQEEIDKAIDEFTADRNEKALAEIEALDPDDPEHRKKVARIWAGFHADVRKFSAKPVDKDGKALAAEAAADSARSARTSPSEAPATVVETQPAEKPTGSQKAPEERQAEIRSYIDSKARAAGIDPDDELWIGVSLTTPSKDKDGKGLSLDQQIEWTVNRFNERKAAIQARARQAAALPLGEGGAPPRAPAADAAATGPISLGDAIARSNERRRL